MTVAFAGIATSVPIAVMTPFAKTNVPLATGALESGTMV